MTFPATPAICTADEHCVYLQLTLILTEPNAISCAACLVCVLTAGVSCVTSLRVFFRISVLMSIELSPLLEQPCIYIDHSRGISNTKYLPCSMIMLVSNYEGILCHVKVLQIVIKL
jgi:hypothetical protein